MASVIGWAFLLSPRPGYLNALLRNLPWWDHLEEGPVDVYTMPWIVIITGFGLTAFVYLFVSSGFANINSELLEAAQVSGSRGLGVFFRITLPLLRPVLVYGGGVALLLGLGQFTGPLLLGRNAGITVLTTEMYFFTSQSPINFGAAAAIGIAAARCSVCVVVIVQKVILGDQARFVTHGGKAFRADARPSKLAVAGHRRLQLPRHDPAGQRAGHRVAVELLERRHRRRPGSRSTTSAQIFDESSITGAVTTSLISLAGRRRRSPCRSASSPPRCCSRGASTRSCGRSSTSSSPCRSASRRSCSASASCSPTPRSRSSSTAPAG